VRSRRVGSLSGLLVLLFLLAAPRPGAAAELSVQSAHASVQGSTLELTVRSVYPVDEPMRTALAAGAIVDLDLQATVDRTNRYWFDERLAEDDLRRELSWNVLSQRYVLQDIKTGEQRTFATLEEALDAAGTVTDWKLDIGQRLDPDARYEVSVRARLRRGRVPSGLRALTFWTRYWSRSEWYTWALPH